MSNLKKISVLRKEPYFGAVVDSTGCFKLKRNSINVNRNIEQYNSNVLTESLQGSAIYEGAETASVSLSAELSAECYSEVIKSYFSSNFTKYSNNILSSLTITQAGDIYTLTATGIETNVTIGSVVRLDGVAVNTSNKTNLLVKSVSVGSIEVFVLNRKELILQSAVIAELVIVGVKTCIPTSGFLPTSFTLENYTEGLSETYSGLVPDSLGFSSSNSFCNLDISFLAKGLIEKGTTQVLISPIELINEPVNTQLAYLLIDGNLHYVTQFSIDSSRDLPTKKDINSSTITGFSVGDYKTTASFTAQLKDWTYDSLLNSEVSVVLVLPANTSDISDYCSIVLPNAKVTSVNTDDSPILMASFTVESVLKVKAGFDYSTLVYLESNSQPILSSWEDIDTWNDSLIWLD